GEGESDRGANVQDAARTAEEIRRGTRHLRHADARVRGRQPRRGRDPCGRHREAPLGSSIATEELTTMKTKRMWHSFAAAVLLSCVAQSPVQAAEVTLMHVHGL